MSEYKCQLVLQCRRMCDIYTWTEVFEHLFIFCKLNEMEETRKPAKGPQVKKVHACLYAYELDFLLEIIPVY